MKLLVEDLRPYLETPATAARSNAADARPIVSRYRTSTPPGHDRRPTSRSLWAAGGAVVVAGRRLDIRLPPLAGSSRCASHVPWQRCKLHRATDGTTHARQHACSAACRRQARTEGRRRTQQARSDGQLRQRPQRPPPQRPPLQRPPLQRPPLQRPPLQEAGRCKGRSGKQRCG